MFSFFGMVLLSSATFAMDAEATRVSYSNCLTDLTGMHVDQKTAAGAFRQAAREACSDERNAFIAAVTKDELEFGSSKKEAEQYATEEANGVLQSFTGSYDDYLASGTKPVRSGGLTN